jgi:uncharacterized protein (TIGR00159 family)
MELLSSILGQIIGVGVLALIIVFQQEIRKFLLFIGNRYINRRRFSFESFFFPNKREKQILVKVDAIVKACRNMSETRTGALIVIARKSELQLYAESGDIIDADTSTRMIENIFFKNSPLHDGAVIIVNDRILAARCVLPITENINLPPHYGMRHKSAIGITEVTDAIAIVVSEETGKISVASEGILKYDISWSELDRYLRDNLSS